MSTTRCCLAAALGLTALVSGASVPAEAQFYGPYGGCRLRSHHANYGCHYPRYGYGGGYGYGYGGPVYGGYGPGPRPYYYNRPHHADYGDGYYHY